MRFFKLFVLLVLTAYLVGLPAGLQAVPAAPYPLQVVQPDGSLLTVLLQGDECSHTARTTDGYYLVANQSGAYAYATLSATGAVVAGPFSAKEPEQRSTEEKRFLQNLSLNQIDQAIRQQVRSTRSGAEVRIPVPSASLGKATRSASSDSRFLVILVSFKDTPFVSESTVFDAMLNQSGYANNGATGSAKDYFSDNSQGQFVPHFDVIGPIPLSREMAYYGANVGSSESDARPREMVIEACTLADRDYGVDFSSYDIDGDGVVDHICVVYAGYNEAQGGGANTIWPHEWAIDGIDRNFILDDTRISTYSCTSELRGSQGTAHENIGTFCHEFCHALGLPDLYDTDYSTNGQGFDPGPYAVMASGSYNNQSRTPPFLSSFERELLGWHQSILLENPTLLSIPHSGIHNVSYKFTTLKADGTENPKEWFFIENRQNVSWDAFIPGHGLLIVHINRNDNVMSRWRNNQVNAYADMQCFDIEEADGIASAQTRADDLFPTETGNKKTFRDLGTPNAKSWEGVSTKKPLKEITESNGLITAVFIDELPAGIQLPAYGGVELEKLSGGYRFTGLEPGSLLQVFTVSGILVEQLQVAESSCELALSTPGLYLIRYTDGSKSFGFKLRF